MKKNRKLTLAGVIAVAGLTLVGCSQAETAKHNISKAADNFEIPRRITFINGITNDYLQVIEGKCSINADREDEQMEVTCKIGPDQYKTDFLGLSDNVFYTAEQLDPVDVSVYHHRVIIKPQSIVPAPELNWGDQ